MKPRVLVASASAGWREEIAKSLDDPGVDLVESSTAREALSLVATAAPPVAAVLIDAALSDASGLALCRSIGRTPWATKRPS